jgi:hypothetical protein
VPGETNATADYYLVNVLDGSTKRLNMPVGDLFGISEDLNRIGVYRKDLYLYDVTLDRNLLADRPSELPSGFATGLSRSGRYAAGRIDLTTVRIRELETGDNFDLSIGRSFGTIYPSFSSGENYLMLENDLDGSGMVDWRTGEARSYLGTFLSSTPDDSELLFTTAVGPVHRGDLYFIRPTEAGSNLVALDVRFPVMSFDGRVVVYNQTDPESGLPQAYHWDRWTDSRFALPTAPGGQRAHFADIPRLSPDGRFIAFNMKRNNGQNDADRMDVYLFDRALTNLTLISRTAEGHFPNAPSVKPFVSADGRIVLFESLASDLVEDDRNMDRDIFVAHLEPADSDGDGLEDGWEWLWFGSLEASALEDADLDGATNLDEWRAGTDPVAATSRFRAEITMSGDTPILRWSGSVGWFYEVLHRESLNTGTWQTVHGPTRSLSAQVTVDLSRLGNPGGFYQVRAVTAAD